MPRAGVLIVGFGGPDSPEAVGPFMCNLMGREPAPEVVARVRSRYEEIGGCSPLLEIAEELANRVASALEEDGSPIPVEVGMRYWEPFIADAVQRLADAGVERIAVVSLSPFEASVTHGEYRAAIEAALLGQPGITALDVPLLSELPAFLDLQTSSVAEALASLDVLDAPIVFSAHSLPLTDVRDGDPYVHGLEQAASAIAARLGLGTGTRAEVLPGIEAFGSGSGPRPWLVAYQSKGVRGGEWLGPDVDDAIEAIAASGGTAVAVAPLGFATDHMETRYDLDVVARRAAEERGLAFVRSALPNAHPAMAANIALAVRETLALP